MRKPIDVLATGLGHPEGPDILPDGRVVMVETYGSRILAWSAELGIHVYADCGGGPNACMLGGDGALYITQNGGTVGAWRADVMSVPSIQKAWPDGRVEIVATEVDGIRLQAPNDLTFGPDGRLYFSIGDRYLPDDRRPGRVFVLNADGTGELLEELDDAYPNGITAEPDGSIVWVESYERRVYRKRPGEPSELICQLPERHIPDGLKVAADGSVWVADAHGGRVAVFNADGSHRKDIAVPLPMVTSLCFAGDDLRDLYIVTGSRGGPHENCGSIFRMRVDVAGLALPMARVVPVIPTEAERSEG